MMLATGAAPDSACPSSISRIPASRRGRFPLATRHVGRVAAASAKLPVLEGDGGMASVADDTSSLQRRRVLQIKDRYNSSEYSSAGHEAATPHREDAHGNTLSPGRPSRPVAS